MEPLSDQCNAKPACCNDAALCHNWYYGGTGNLMLMARMYMMLQGSQAYAKALAKAGVLDAEEAQTIADGLSKVADEWRSGSFEVGAWQQ